jgi:hypothetical protein
MSKSELPTSPTNSRFGWPKPSRTEEFKKAAPTGATTRIVFRGKTVDLPIISVPIELPKYRMANGRTVSLQAEYLAKNPGSRQDMFSGDPELWDAQEVQHHLLLQYAEQSRLQEYFEDTTNKQVEPILLDENGFVVNGNRRLSTWRELLFTTPEKYGHFRHLDVAVLPHCTERDIDRLEVKLQIEQDIQADYIWHAHANMMLAQQKRDGFSNKELAELHRMKEGKVQELFDMRAYADEYLRSRGKANIWSLVTEHEFAFRKIVSSRPKINGIGNQEIFKQAAYALIDNPEEAGVRLYQAIPEIMVNLDQVKTKLQEGFDVKAAATDPGLENLFGSDGGSPVESPTDMPLAKDIQNQANADKARKIIVEVIESQRQLKKDSKTANYLLDCCAKAQALLAAGIKDGLRAESNTKGVEKQLDQIQAQVERVRKFVKQNAKN